MDARTPRLFFTAATVYFACIGFATLIASVATWHFGQVFPALALAYTAMNLLLSTGFYLREKWLLPLLALNCAGYTCVYAAAWALGSDVSVLRFALSTILAGGTLGLVYYYRDLLVEQPYSLYTGAVFLGLWILTFTYTATGVL
ncbi:MAG TPA: hypothetical protein VHD31_00075 [Candidatus Paceibacterota bacterium]|nr:hypothetical protein [Candidatus Paceibacterota bacterium]